MRLGCGIARLGWCLATVALAGLPTVSSGQTATDDDDSLPPIIGILYVKDRPPGAVQITAPSAGAQIVNDTPVSLVATATDPDGSIRTVSFYANGGSIPLCSSTQSVSPFSCTYSFPTVGSVTLTAQAFDNFGKALASAPVTIAIVPTSARQYVYDAQGRLTGVIGNNGDAARYVYDKAGNILRIDRIGNTGIALLGAEPPSGAVGGSIILYGIGFSTTPSQNAVRFNGTAATVTQATANQLTVTVPAGATTGPIAVTAFSQTDTSANAFTVQAAPSLPTISNVSPLSGNAPAMPGALGTQVTISGANFAVAPDVNEVKFNGTIAAVTSATATSIQTNVPFGATTGRISVRTKLGTATSATNFVVSVAGASAPQVLTLDGSSPVVSVTNPTNTVGVVVFDGTAGQNVGLGISGVSVGTSTFSIVRPDGATLVLSTPLPTSGAALALDVLPLTGTYSILLSPAANTTVSATFTLSTPLAGTVAVGGAATPVSSSRPGQGARVTFPAAQFAGYSVLITGTGTSNGRVAIYQPGGLLVTGPQSIAAQPIAPPLARTPGNFTIALSPTSGTPLANISVAVLGDVIGSITYGSGSPQTFNVATAGQVNLLAFTLNASSIVDLYKPSGGVPIGAQIVDTYGNGVPLGSSAPAGNYYVVAVPNNLVATGIGSVQLGVADLALQSVSIVPNPISVLCTNVTVYSFSINYVLVNNGSLPAANTWQDWFFLSQANNVPNGTILPSNSPSIVINPGASAPFSLPATLNANSVTVGTQYYVVGQTEYYSNQIDSNSSNNIKSAPVTFSAYPPCH